MSSVVMPQRCVKFDERVDRECRTRLALAPGAMAAVHEHWSGREPIRHLPARASAGEALVFIRSHRSRHEVEHLLDRIREHVEEAPGAMLTSWEPFFVEEGK